MPRFLHGRTVARVAVACAAVLVTAGCSSDSSAYSTPGTAGGSRRTVTVTSAPPTLLPAAAQNVTLIPPAHVDEVSTVAKARVASVAVYKSTGDTTPWMTLKNPTASSAPLVFLLQEAQGDWLRVLLPVRPNQAQGWIHRADVDLLTHNYRIVVSLAKHRLTVYQGASVFMSEPVGLGTSTLPTPGGVFFTVELLKPKDPKGSYGPYAYGLSGFSTVLNEFMGGDGRIGIHGTNDPAGIGRNVSHGCIRMSNAAISKLAPVLPLGVPVQIVK